jgi:hypothetical protein
MGSEGGKFFNEEKVRKGIVWGYLMGGKKRELILWFG